MKRIVKKIAVGLSAVGMAGSSLIVAGAVLEPASAAGTCPNNNWSNVVNTRVNNNFSTGGVNIRTGDSVNCTPIGQGQPGHDTLLHCNNYNGSWNWNHLRDITNGKVGWVRVDNLDIWTINPC
ncbi:hypothetical protein [Nocardioides sp. W7]|uniref:hypothetical protein n=1 Tax=Nocardioides sp. W7 TaxID=2931390 RepID=UPI001FD51759|nr:hypothetical protein [Nocardioides sp. W7]